MRIFQGKAVHAMRLLPTRQIHLDFHTSEKIDGIASDFHAEEFAETAKAAHINSMTVFARCHHGYLYYHSKAFPERVHPGLTNVNLLPDQVRALHARGIKAPVYITVQTDYYSATRHPEWLIRKRDGAHEGGPFTEAGFYQSLCVNTGYMDFLLRQTGEVMDLLGDALDGLFFDIVGIRPCLCAACRKEMQETGVDMNDDEQVRAFAKKSMDRFRTRMTDFVRQRNANCTIFYNAGHVGPCARDSADTFTHFELESLPSGGWGYLHFPVTARYARKLGKDCMGMTGKFHTSWGDFHSLKNQAALEFECFRMLSFGFACSVGDQLEPCGKLNPAVYRLIGRVYDQIEQREAWARPSVGMAEAALLTTENPIYEHRMPDSVMGASQLLEELAVQFDVLDETMALEGYRLVILPDDFTVSPCFREKLERYVRQGGKVLACFHGGMDAENHYAPCLGAEYAGDTAIYPDFVIAHGPLCDALEPENEYVIYLQGAQIQPKGGQTLLEARAPYFMRSGEHFCSHRYTPSAKGAGYPAAIGTENTVLFAHPMFGQYRKNAPNWVKKLVAAAIDRLLPQRLVRHDGPSTLSAQLLDQKEQGRACLHVLSYIPVRKCAEIDIVEERTVQRNVRFQVNLDRPIASARLVPENIPLDVADGAFTVPEINGYQIVELTYQAEK